MTILKVVQFGDVPEEILTEITVNLRNEFNFETESSIQKSFPKTTFNPLRNQYDSKLILEFLSRNFNVRTLAVTDADIYTDRLNYVFGQAISPGNSAVISINRLKSNDKDLHTLRSTKEAVHEVGHMLGLKHCLNSKCVMSFSNNVTEVDIKNKTVCLNCKSKISSFT